MAGSPVARQHPFGLGISPIRRVMDSPGLSAAGIRFLQLPFPAEGLVLPYGRVTGSKTRPQRGYPVPHPRRTAGFGAFFTPGPVVCA